MNRNSFLILLIAVLFVGCDDLFDPAIENHPDRAMMYTDAKYAQGILLNGYTRIPTGGWSFNDVATDDAVSNDKGNGYMKMATGQWASNNNPADQWHNSFAAIQYLNITLEESDKVQWASDENTRRMFNDRMKGEAYGLRGLYMYHLLKAHAGWTDNGELLGVPVLTSSQSTESDFNQPRATFEQCMQQLYADLDKAEDLLPLDYEDISDDAQVPAKYAGITKEEYSRVFGKPFRQRITTRIV
ncbi:MAG: RagB/SusD family nutrient uptake outer membrane protein, partial [Dysgonamonadaceae bacterium]|nr:RagB/SusD family nutrient uptake outer membrane protein [Dysgonamonadaceae bacterium]